jgi:ferredoxin
LQWGVLAAIVVTIIVCNLTGTPVDPESYCPMGGLQALGSYFVNNSLACTMSMVQIMMGVVLAIGVVLFSKLFCGYLCPLGTVGEALGKLGAKMKVLRTIPIGSVADKALRIVKYALMFVIVYFSVGTSELFCKKLDPFYAMATGFQGEIVVWMVVITMALLFLGSIFFKQFWCKYICPLGALSNIFKFTILFVAMIVVMWGLGLAGIPNVWVWVLAATCIIAYVVEIWKMRSSVFPLLYIRRDDDKCTQCGICQKKCPYSIPAQAGPVKMKHVDCTLCATCVKQCPFDALSVTSKKRKLAWLPGVITVALVGIAFWLGSTTELPTIDEKWGDYEKVTNMQIFELDGLTSVKCYSSSRAFSTKMQTVPGVYGVKTFVRRHGVVISYDPAVVTPEQIQEAIFTPMSLKFRTPAEGIDSVKVVKLGLEGLHDRMDLVNLGMLLRRMPEIYGFDARFACPVDVYLFVDPAATVDRKVLRDSIEVKSFMMGQKEYKPTFKFVTYDEAPAESVDAFLENMFTSTKALGGIFKKSSEKYASDEYAKAVYEMPYPEVEKPIVSRSIPYLRSHMSNFDGIQSVDFALKNRVPVMQITYVKSMWNDDRIWNEILQAPVWTINYKDGTAKEEDARLGFDTPGKTIE